MGYTLVVVPNIFFLDDTEYNHIYWYVNSPLEVFIRYSYHSQ